ncbi:hypothetical protein ACMC9I_09205 [Deinococcota bacterium DY0809b]
MAALPALVLIGAVAALWLVVRAFRMPKIGPLAGTALALWGTAWALYFASRLGLLNRFPSLDVLLWLLLFAGYLPFVLLLRRLAQDTRLPLGLYAFALFPIGFTFAAIQHVHPATHLYVLLLLQLLLLYPPGTRCRAAGRPKRGCSGCPPSSSCRSESPAGPPCRRSRAPRGCSGGS